MSALFVECSGLLMNKLHIQLIQKGKEGEGVSVCLTGIGTPIVLGKGDEERVYNWFIEHV